MAFDVEAAKQDGYTDEEIQQYLATKDQPIAQEQPHERGDEYGTVAINALPTIAEGVGIGYGVKKAAEAFRGAPVAPGSTPAMNPAGGGVQGPAPSAGTYKVPGTGLSRPTYNAPTVGEPVLNPTWDNALKQPVKQGPSMMERGTQYARQMQQIAAEKVMQGARAMAPAAELVGGAARAIAPAAAGIASAVTPGNIGQNYPVPQSGPMRGMEINPRTGRPWTQQELAMMR